jgi:adenylate cyclase
MPPAAPAAPPPEYRIKTFDDALGHRVVETHIWAVREGLRGATAYDLFDGYCQRLVIDGVPLWRAHTAMETLHPQWGGYGYTWRRDLNAIHPEHYAHGGDEEEKWMSSPIFDLVRRARDGEENPIMRRRLEAGPEERDFPVLEEFFAEGATDYFAQLFAFGEQGDRSHGSGIVYSFATNRHGGFSEDDSTLMQATLPALSLAIKGHAGRTIASGLLETYLGEDAGRRVYSGAVERGSMDVVHAVLWYADIRGFTPTSDAARAQGRDRAATCHRALDAAIEAMANLEALNAVRAAAGLPVPAVDLALHLGDVLYGNVGANDRLDFTVIGPAVNEVARIETLCEPLGRAVLVSAEFAAAAADVGGRLESLGRFALRGVREEKEIFAFLTAASPGGAAST